MFDRVRVLGEQRNHKVERVDLSPHALNIPLFLTQHLIQVLHDDLPTPRGTLDFVTSFLARDSSSGVEQALDRLRPLLRFRFSSHELGRPGQR
jgi:hypothetical protein